MTPAPSVPACSAVVIGGGPAGLMAAERLLHAGIAVDLYDAMPSLGRKFLLAGIGGLNITHAEPQSLFLSRYGAAQGVLSPWLHDFGADALRAWVHALGVETFVGSSGRVFPREMKAAPLLRRWLQRLRGQGLRVHTRHRWLGWSEAIPADGAGQLLRFATPAGEVEVATTCVVLALGGGSWARLGSDGAWLPWLAARGVALAPLQAANCGFDATAGGDGNTWSAPLRAHAGHPLKAVSMRLPWTGESSRRGECVLTESGLEGSLIYALSQAIRERINSSGAAEVLLDLLPDREPARLQADLARPRGKLTLTRHWQRAGLEGVKASLLRELLPAGMADDPLRLARFIKALPVTLVRPRPMDEAISTAGGVCFSALDQQLMLSGLPGVFCCGEMLDWEAPTGGYLLTACLATGRAAGEGAAVWCLSSVASLPCHQPGVISVKQPDTIRESQGVEDEQS